MVYFKGDACSQRIIEQSMMATASRVYVLTGDDEVNCRVAMSLSEVLLEKKTKQNLKCYVSLENQRQRDFLEDFAGSQANKLEIQCFNLYEQAARNIIRDKGIVSNASQNVHCVVIGNTPVAKAVLLQTLRMLHLYKSQKRVVTVICRDSENFKKQLYLEFPCLSQEVSSEMELARQGVFPLENSDVDVLRFVEMPIGQSGWYDDNCSIYEYLQLGWRINLYMCIDDGIQSLAIRELIRKRIEFQVNEYESGTETNLEKPNLNYYYNYLESVEDNSCNRWTSFGDYTQACTMDAIEDASQGELARDIFSVYGKVKEWLKEESWSKASSRQSADHVYVKLALAGLSTCSSFSDIKKELGEFEYNKEDGKQIEKSFGIKTVEIAEIEHRRWVAERLLVGWLPLTSSEQKKWNNGHGQKKQKDCHRHGCLVPFDKLEPREKEQRKDYAIAGGICNWTEHIKKNKEDVLI
jgi:hypothetical protein